MSVLSRDSKVTEQVSGLYMVYEGHYTEISTRKEDRNGSEFCPEGHNVTRVLLTRPMAARQGEKSVKQLIFSIFVH